MMSASHIRKIACFAVTEFPHEQTAYVSTAYSVLHRSFFHPKNQRRSNSSKKSKACFIAAAFLCCLLRINAAITPYAVPAEFQSNRFEVTVDGTPVQVAHTTGPMFHVNFDFTGTVEVSVTAADPDYWSDGVIVSPMVRNIYPRVNGATVTFTLTGPAKLTVERPGTRDRNKARGKNPDPMLCVFANPPEQDPPAPGDRDVIYLGPGVHDRNVDVASNKTLYLHGNAWLKGSVNVFNARNARIRGRGVVFHSEPKINKCMDVENSIDKNTRPLTVAQSPDLNVEGVILVCKATRWMVLVRSRSHNARFNNVKVFGYQPTAGGQGCIDGIDFFGGTGCLVNDCFLRTGDNAFLNWGNEVTVTGSYIWTTGANVIMSCWGNNCNRTGLMIRNCDIVHLGNSIHQVLATGGTLGNFLFEDLRIEVLGGLTAYRMDGGTLSNTTWRRILMYAPPIRSGGMGHRLFSAVGSGAINGVVFEKLRINNTITTKPQDIGMIVQGPVSYNWYTVAQDGGPTASMRATGTGPVTFSANASKPQGSNTITRYLWYFGDGQSATGRNVTHHYRYDDDYRAFLTVTDNRGKKDMTTLLLKGIKRSGATVMEERRLNVAGPQPQPMEIISIDGRVIARTGGSTGLAKLQHTPRAGVYLMQQEGVVHRVVATVEKAAR